MWVRYVDKNQNTLFILTSKETSRDFYFLYEVAGDSFRKLGKARSPTELEEKFRVIDRLQEQ